MTEQLYFDDPLHLEFDAEVTEVFPLSGGTYGAALPRTYAARPAAVRTTTPGRSAWRT